MTFTGTTLTRTLLLVLSWSSSWLPPCCDAAFFSSSTYLRNTGQPSSAITTLQRATAPLVITDHAPSWKSLEDELLETDAGRQLHALKQDTLYGHGPPSAQARLRLFDETDESKVRVTFYRDSAAWCPYSQKVNKLNVVVCVSCVKTRFNCRIERILHICLVCYARYAYY